jgi:potassium-transporting ATPase potassium-binding subunit
MIAVLGGSALLSWPLSRYMKRVLDPEASRGVDRFFEKVLGPDVLAPQDWKRYALAMLVFNGVMFGAGYLFLALQSHLPLNPDGKGPLEPSLIYNTVCSFLSNTNLQHYSGERSLSYFSQLFCIAWNQFVSAAVGISVFLALVRGLAGRAQMGNFFQDMYRVVFYVLLPAATVVALLLILCGVPMTFNGAIAVRTLEGSAQHIARGPVAAVVAIKQLGTNGGGFFGPNSSHPFENPNLISNIIENISIVLIPMACVWLFGRITGRSHGRLGHDQDPFRPAF